MRKSLAQFLAQVAGLLATGWLIWIAAVAPRVHRFTWGSVIGRALGFALLAWIASAAITFLLYLALPSEERRDVLWVSLRTAGAAVWFAPAIILLTNYSPAALAASLVLIVTATRLLYGEWRTRHPGEWHPYVPPGMFGANLPTPRAVPEHFTPALWIALCLQSSVAAALLGTPLLAAALLAATAALLTIYAISTGALETEQPRKLPQAAFGVVLTLLLASGLTVGGLSGRIVRHPSLAGGQGNPAEPGASLVESARATLRSLVNGDQPPASDDAKATPTPKVYDSGPFPPGSFPGVVLTSEVRPVPLLVAPMPANRALLGGAAKIFAIPFDGEYWIYRYLYRRPPANSYRRKGSPAALSFSTTDRWPLMMEAHQKFDQAIDLRCCRAVRVEIWNADPHPGTLSLELTALDGDSSRSAIIGTVPVRSAPDLGKSPVTAVPESLEFAIPANIIDNCTELKLVFRRVTNLDRSARVAIDRFVLEPR